jgi:hypothetical protein
MLIAGSVGVGESLGVDSRAPTFDLPARVRWCTARAEQWACAWLSWEYDLAVGWIAALEDTLDAAAAIYAQACGGASPTASRSPRNTSARLHRLMASVFERGASTLARTC